MKVFNTIIQNGGDNDSIEYIDLSSVSLDDEMAGMIMVYSVLARFTHIADFVDGRQTGINTLTYISKLSQLESIEAIAIDVNLRIYNYIYGYKTIKDILQLVGVYEYYSNLPRLTEEEFYNL